MRDGSDGAALLAVVHYYCPGHMKLDGECGAPSTPRGCGPGRATAQGHHASRSPVPAGGGVCTTQSG